MPSNAITKLGKSVDAEDFRADEWKVLKATANLGDYLMPCCKTPAIPKTSVRGLQFFAHLNDECITAPETNWHKEGKAAVLDALAALGLVGASEVCGGQPGDEWKADTLFEVDGRRIAIELQRSYQSVDDYIARQERYARFNVECFWLTRRANMSAIVKVTGRLRMKREWGGKFPPGRSSFAPLLAEFPLSILDLGLVVKVLHVGQTESSLEDWIRAIVQKRYLYNDGAWHQV